MRQELQSYRRSAHGACTQTPSLFLYELAADPLALHRRYLSEHRERA